MFDATVSTWLQQTHRKKAAEKVNKQFGENEGKKGEHEGDKDIKEDRQQMKADFFFFLLTTKRQTQTRWLDKCEVTDRKSNNNTQTDLQNLFDSALTTSVQLNV